MKPMPFALAAFTPLMLVIAPPVWADQITDKIREARDLATHQWQPDSRLVYIKVSGYGFAPTEKPGAPLKRNNTPTNVLFYFYSDAHGGRAHLQVNQQINLAVDNEEVFRARPDLGAMRWNVLPSEASFIPWQVDVSDGIMPVSEAVTLAQKSALDRDCAGSNPFYGCGNVTMAELHTYIVGSGESLPIWRIQLGQDARAKEVVRLVNAKTGRLITNCSVPDSSVPATARGNIYLECS